MQNRENRKCRLHSRLEKNTFIFSHRCIACSYATPINKQGLPRGEKFLYVGRVYFRNYNNHKGSFYISIVIFFIVYAFAIAISLLK